jgi:acyl-CoA thioester hydrolase
MIMHRHSFRVRYGDTDPMGWAYYANYLRWFEAGRAEMMRDLGRSYRDVEESLGVFLPVLQARCRYVRGARYDDLVRVETGVASRARASVVFAYRIVRDADDELLATGMTEHCCVDRGGRPVRPPAELVRLLEDAPRAPVGTHRDDGA